MVLRTWHLFSLILCLTLPFSLTSFLSHICLVLLTFPPFFLFFFTPLLTSFLLYLLLLVPHFVTSQQYSLWRQTTTVIQHYLQQTSFLLCLPACSFPLTEHEVSAPLLLLFLYASRCSSGSGDGTSG